ncbi:hypothetical protein J2Z62_000545 [Mycoplasmoides fastidiosum]|uniref:DUF31 domain-containing protein n=1 Tax=Mycoplasmoides fastidiosum TaxID=92758 RepID=A0ABU0LZH6_9BACT|nr:hypothetical protein [Mycoplasmoides fastidiosum]MDQ0514107.1 hypothetical protein [Mycoplasmoides fastidiosum]UUD37485.1 hypothetical protein NPA10_02845 [Mycoplasmoides fastidiosum]
MQVYQINDPQFIVDDYQLIFTANDFEWNVRANFYIFANYNLPPRTLFYDMKFSEQDINNVYLQAGVPCAHQRDRKPENSKLKCYFYQSNFNVRVSGDKSFLNPLNNETILANLNFKVDAENFRNIVTDQRQQITDQIFDQFVESVEKNKFKVSFLYDNFFEVRRSGNQTQYEISPLTSWTVYKNSTTNRYQRTRVRVNLDDYRYINNTPIKRLVRLESLDNQPIEIKGVSSLANYYVPQEGIEKKLEIPYANISIRPNRSKTNVDVSMQGTSIFENNTLSLGENNGASGLFIPYKSRGNYANQMTVLVGGARFLVNTHNSFEFQKDFIQTDLQSNYVRLKSIGWRPRNRELVKYKRIEF